MNKKRFLFFFVHPAKFHLFKITINFLIKNGNTVDILIVKKDVLEDLVKREKWNYYNILPNGRRSAIPIVGTIIFAIKTIFKIEKYLYKKKYDMFITDDLLVISGFFRNINTLFFQDDDLSAVPENSILLLFAKNVVAPNCTNLGKFNKNKIGYNGNHEWAYLSPKVFKPNFKEIKKIVKKNEKYFIIRLVSLTASHDLNKKGISDENAKQIIKILEPHGRIFINSERELKPEFEKYRVNLKPHLIHHFLFFAHILISDSQTMTSEAAMLGVPSLRYNDFVGRISYIERSEKEYGLTYGFKTLEFKLLIKKLLALLNEEHLKEKWLMKRKKIERDFDDVNHFFQMTIEKNCKL